MVEFPIIDRKKRTRLFQCTNAKGTFRVFEIHDFAQDDLENEDVMMLDVWTEVSQNYRKNS